jgi:hypothetical protein
MFSEFRIVPVLCGWRSYVEYRRFLARIHNNLSHTVVVLLCRWEGLSPLRFSELLTV